MSSRCSAPLGAPIVIGLALWWPLLRTSITGVAFAGITVFGQPAAQVFSGVAVAFVTLTACIPDKAWHRYQALARSTLIFLTLLSGVCSLLLELERGAAPVLLPILAATSLAALFALFPLAWCRVLEESGALRGSYGILLVIGSYILSYLPDYLSFWSNAVQTARPIVSPLLSSVCLVWAGRMATTRSLAPASSPCPATGAAPGTEPPLFIGTLVAVYLINSLIVGIIRTGSFEYLVDSFLLSRVSASIAVAFLLALLVAWATKQSSASNRMTQERTVLGLAILLTLSALLLAGLLITSVSPDNQRVFDLGIGLISATSSCISVLLFSLAAISMNGRRRPSVFLTCTFTGPVLINVVIRTFGIPGYLGTASGFWGMPSLIAGLLLAIAFMTLSATLFIRSLATDGGALAHKPSGQAATTEIDAHAVPHHEATSALRERYGLSPREQDLVILLLQGNTFKRAAQLLGLGEGTIQTYAKKIYRKTGVHSKQELIDLAHRATSPHQTGADVPKNTERDAL